jgi:hypothetical protein
VPKAKAAMKRAISGGDLGFGRISKSGHTARAGTRKQPGNPDRPITFVRSSYSDAGGRVVNIG